MWQLVALYAIYRTFQVKGPLFSWLESIEWEQLWSTYKKITLTLDKLYVNSSFLCHNPTTCWPIQPSQPTSCLDFMALQQRDTTSTFATKRIIIPMIARGRFYLNVTLSHFFCNRSSYLKKMTEFDKYSQTWLHLDCSPKQQIWSLESISNICVGQTCG